MRQSELQSHVELIYGMQGLQGLSGLPAFANGCNHTDVIKFTCSSV